MKLLLATSNRGKVQEMREALDGLGLEFVDLRELPTIPQSQETGSTFAENARQKAVHYYSHTKHPTVSDDSGILIDALKKELGIHTRRWGAGPDASDDEWIAYFLDRMKREENKRAKFVCAIHYIDAEGHDHAFEGVCDGVITETLEAEYLPGLPLSACFKPDGYDLVFSALSIEQKNSTSHRGRALMGLRKFLMPKAS